MSTPATQARLEALARRYEELTANLGSPSLVGNRDAFAKASKEHSELAPIVEAYRRWQKATRELAENEEMAKGSDKDLADLAYEEVGRLRQMLPAIEAELQVLLTPKDPHEGKSIILEVRAGTGGDEAALFAGDLFRMYSKYAANKGWRVELLDANETEGGGFKEVSAMLHGSSVYRQLRWESGVHRVQRVPETEASGRKHTSTATVAVMPEVEVEEVNIRTEDLKVDTYRSGGAGGQHVNKTESAIRITHMPSGIVVACQMERSQHKNRATAMKMLAAKLKNREREERESKIAADRSSQVGTGDRSERIRTYNFHEGRVSDHRIKLNLHQLPEIMNGDLDELLGALVSHYSAEALKAGADAPSP